MITPEQERAIASRGKVIVSASAGSGKTFVMIERLVSLILNGADVRRVLCVTFTNKAAAQMRDRLRTALIKKIGEVAGEERERLKAQLAALPLADISTIHAFCGRLIRTHFYLADVDPAFRIISPDDSEGKLLISHALAETFETAYETGGEAFSRLLSVYFRKKKDARLKQIVLGIWRSVRGSADYIEILSAAGEDRFDSACAFLYEYYCDRAGFLRDVCEERGAFFAEKFPRALPVCKSLIGACDALLGANDLFGMTALAQEPPEIARMPSSAKAEGETAAQLKFLAGISKSVKALYSELREYAAEETERARSRDAACRAAALASLALSFDENYRRMKREAGLLDYDDLEHLALKILSDPAANGEISEKYEYAFVDEYQDVNPVQERILSLVGGGEIFLVGDAKQAIYGFRGSRSEYFEAKESELERSLKLTSNFRSASAVLDAVNRVFAPLLGDRYVPMRGGDRYGDYRGEVLFHRVEEEETQEKQRDVYSVLANAAQPETDALAEKVVSVVESELGKEWFDADEGKYKRVEYGDIAVLARKNTGDAERIVAALAQRGVPVTTSSKTNICDSFEARLLVDWLSYLDNAEQDVPFATALLSAAGGFTEEELAQIRLRFPSPFTFRAACAEYAEKMTTPLAVKLKEFYARTEERRALAQILPAAEILGTLLAEGLEAQIAAKPGGSDRLARVGRLVAEAESAGSVHGFLSRLKAADYRIDFSESGGDRAVKVLTMHASKGLEYPVVILAGMDANFHGADRDEWTWTDAFRIAPKSFDEERKLVYETVVRRAAAVVQESREIKDECNLLYVAMTRARCRLHMLFGEKERALHPRFAKRFSDMIDLSACADYFAEDAPPAGESRAREALAYRSDPQTEAQILAAYGREYPFAESTSLPVKSSATALMQTVRAEEIAPPSSRGGGYDADTGTAYHAFLEYVVFGQPAERELERMRNARLLTEAQCALLDPAKLQRILQIPCLNALAGKRVWREQTFLVLLPACEVLPTQARDEIVFQGAIDLLCEDGNGYTVIDYKFSSHDEARIRRDYALQIKLYKKAVARAKRVDEKTVRARIVNIAQCIEIEM